MANSDHSELILAAFPKNSGLRVIRLMLEAANKAHLEHLEQELRKHLPQDIDLVEQAMQSLWEKTPAWLTEIRRLTGESPAADAGKETT